MYKEPTAPTSREIKKKKTTESFADQLYALRGELETNEFSVDFLDKTWALTSDKSLFQKSINKESLNSGDRDNLAAVARFRMKGEMLGILEKKYEKLLRESLYSFKRTKVTLEKVLEWTAKNYSYDTHPFAFKTLGYLLDAEQERQVGKRDAIDVALSFVKNREGSFDEWRLKFIFEKDDLYALQKLLELFQYGELGTARIKNIIFLCTTFSGAEEIRYELDRLILSNGENETVKNNLERARSFITPNDDKVAILNLQKFYQENIKFEEYKVNEKMNAREVELLESLIGKDQKVLEMGCGTGRLITELAKDGYDAAGYDFTERHVKITKEEIEKSGNIAKIFQGDWHGNALADESLDTVYSLGRNILHDYSIVDQAQLFREANRILKPGGRFIFDIPDREAGGYQKMVGEYAEEMKRRGIRNFRYGTIYDSPDGKNFATRYAYSPDDIEELARLTGFKIAKIEKRELETGQGDENLYYVLEKIDKKFVS